MFSSYALLPGISLASATSISFPRIRSSFLLNLFTFPEFIWVSGQRKKTCSTQSQDRAVADFPVWCREEIFQWHEANPGGTVRNRPLAGAEGTRFVYPIRTAFFWCRRFIRCCRIPDSYRAVMKLCERRGQGKNDTLCDRGQVFLSLRMQKGAGRG